MTTIAYKHKDREIAVDSRSTSNGMIISDSENKVIKRNGQIFFGTSAGDDWLDLIDIYFGAEPAKQAYDCAVMFTSNDSVWLMEFINGELSKWRLNEDNAIGSGCQFALSAMDFGKSAREAVRYAAKRDSHTGGRIRVFKV